MESIKKLGYMYVFEIFIWKHVFDLGMAVKCFNIDIKSISVKQ